MNVQKSVMERVIRTSREEEAYIYVHERIRISYPKGKHKQEEMEEEESFSYAMQLVSLNVLSMAMYTVTELGIFDIIAKEGSGAKLSAEEIAAQLPCKNSEAATMIDRILRLLACNAVFDCTVVADEDASPPQLKRLYAINTVSKYFTSFHGAGSLGPHIILVNDKTFLDSRSVFLFLLSLIN